MFFYLCMGNNTMYLWQDKEVASDDINVRREDSSNSSFSGDGAGPSSPGISTDVSIVWYFY